MYVHVCVYIYVCMCVQIEVGMFIGVAYCVLCVLCYVCVVYKCNQHKEFIVMCISKHIVHVN